MTALALLVVPIVLGALVGTAIRRVRQQRLKGVFSAAVCLSLPILIVALWSVASGTIGLWDALLEGALTGLGVLGAAHAALADRRPRVVLAGTFLVGLVALEIVSRLFLPVPPSFPSEGGPHLFLKEALKAESGSLPWDARSREIVCQVVYGDEYQSILESPQDPRLLLPGRNSASEARPVLHVGDSMVFGFGVQSESTFVADLGRLDPTSLHLNAGIPGLAPDAYLAVLQRWLDRVHPKLVFLYLFEGNDVEDLDGPYPCCQWEPLLSYDHERAALRCPHATVFDPGRAGFTWLRYNSPSPYLVRIFVPHSRAAAFIAAALTRAGGANSLRSDASTAEKLQHLAAIVRTAQEELKKRDVPIAVVLLPSRAWVQTGEADAHPVSEITKALAPLNMPLLDASDVVRHAAQRGDHLFIGDGRDCHFNDAGHRLIADWLNEQMKRLSQ